MSAPGRGGAIFDPQGYNLNNLGRGLLGEAMYQILTPGLSGVR